MGDHTGTATVPSTPTLGLTDRELLRLVLTELQTLAGEVAELRDDVRGLGTFATTTEAALEDFRQKLSGGMLGKLLTRST